MVVQRIFFANAGHAISCICQDQKTDDSLASRVVIKRYSVINYTIVVINDVRPSHASITDVQWSSAVSQAVHSTYVGSEFSGWNDFYIFVTSGSGMGANVGAARRRVPLATVLLRPPSGHHPGRRQARHARILQMGVHLTQL